ncbi:MAG: ribosome silencing factor [Deltaproteobacteria bacterium]|nr:ribosome silencing factor [Deltaproteobacteria bacterium]
MTKKTQGGIPAEVQPFFDAAEKRKGEGLVALDVRGKSSVADFFVLVSGNSSRQVTAIAETIVDEMVKQGRKPLGREGVNEGQWALLDYGDVVVHVFYDPVRSFYDLEGLWSDAPRIWAGRKESIHGRSEAL